MRQPHPAILKVLVKHSARPVEDVVIDQKSGAVRSTWVVDGERLPPLMLELEGDGADPRVLTSELVRYKLLDLLAPTVDLQVDQDLAVIFVVALMLEPKRTVVVNRWMAAYELGDEIWMKLAFTWLTHTWYADAYIEANKPGPKRK